ncbi:hypothetical protein R3W88_003146 [Solanum pinnatisectum]|uniref:Uncharacterized protein n=1 Tax=Solanum pinnatisectum TaxID=50273 RepID=A0AAV9MN55_9SOLN|nr:hypothetical protein R3W88_003146 [Solanum pinnatisectum]
MRKRGEERSNREREDGGGAWRSLPETPLLLSPAGAVGFLPMALVWLFGAGGRPLSFLVPADCRRNDKERMGKRRGEGVGACRKMERGGACRKKKMERGGG